MENMRHEYIPKGRLLHEEGSEAEKFYIILMGTVAVYISDTADNNVNKLKRFKPFSPKCFEKANKSLQDKYEFMKMKTGDAFGEVSLMQSKPNTESIVSTTNCHFAIMYKRDFERTLMRIEMKTKSDWKTFFRDHPVFNNLTVNSIEKLFYLIELKTYIRGQHIF